MPTGIIIDAFSLFAGGLIGSRWGKYLPKRTCEFLSALFGITSIVIGITLVVKINSLSAVMLSIILGAVIGEGFKLEEKIENAGEKAQALFFKRSLEQIGGDDSFAKRYVSLFILFCMGSTGIIGAVTEGFTGDGSILLAKAVLDFFGALVFASSMGVSVAAISCPLIIIYGILYTLSGAVMPYLTVNMIADFTGCGGVIALVTGLRIADIKVMRLASLLPALALVMPVSWMFAILFI